MWLFNYYCTSNLKWNDHCQCVVHRATQSLNQLRRAVYGCTDRAKALAHLALERPHLECCNVVWTLHTSKNIDLCSIKPYDEIRALLIALLFGGRNPVVSALVNLNGLLWS